MHRDLKPANIKLRDDGTVKVLDFGLAKVWNQDGFRASGVGGTRRDGRADAHLAAHPEQGRGVTMVGVILGTPAYMSPEQARGQAVDKRTDVWAFGCVPLRNGQRAASFVGEKSRTSSPYVVSKEPDWSVVPRPVLRLGFRRARERSEEASS